MAKSRIPKRYKKKTTISIKKTIKRWANKGFWLGFVVISIDKWAWDKIAIITGPNPIVNNKETSCKIPSKPKAINATFAHYKEHQNSVSKTKPDKIMEIITLITKEIETRRTIIIEWKT